MADGVEIITLFNRFPELPAEIQRAVSRIVRKAAFDIQKEAQRHHPFQNQSSFAENSIYVVTHNSSTYGQGIDAIPQGASLLPEVEKPTSTTEAIIAVGADYGVYLEMGTVNMPAFPYLVPAAEKVAPAYVAALRALEDSLEL